jgi:hypothetical protein
MEDMEARIAAGAICYSQVALFTALNPYKGLIQRTFNNLPAALLT